MAFRPGSVFEADLGEGYDIVLLTNTFHHFDMATCERLMTRSCGVEGWRKGLEFVPNDRRTPPLAAAFTLIMLAGTDSREAYTFSQYEKMFRNAGFVRTTEHAVPAIASLGEIGNPREEKKQADH